MDLNQTDSELAKRAHVEYRGVAGVTRFCLEGIQELMMTDVEVTQAKMLTEDYHHAFMLTVGEDYLIAVKDGFSSGYGGELTVLRNRSWLGKTLQPIELVEQHELRQVFSLRPASLAVHMRIAIGSESTAEQVSSPLPNRLLNLHMQHRHMDCTILSGPL